MTQKDVDNKIPIYKLKTTNEIMKYYDEWGIKNKYDQDMVDWNYTGPKESVNVFKKYALNKNMFDLGKIVIKFISATNINWNIIKLKKIGKFEKIKNSKIFKNEKINCSRIP